MSKPKLVSTFIDVKVPGRVAKVYRLSNTDEWRVTVLQDGVKEGDSFYNDREDAESMAQYEVERMIGKESARDREEYKVVMRRWEEGAEAANLKVRVPEYAVRFHKSAYIRGAQATAEQLGRTVLAKMFEAEVDRMDEEDLEKARKSLGTMQ